MALPVSVSVRQSLCIPTAFSLCLSLSPSVIRVHLESG